MHYYLVGRGSWRVYRPSLTQNSTVCGPSASQPLYFAIKRHWQNCNFMYSRKTKTDQRRSAWGWASPSPLSSGGILGSFLSLTTILNKYINHSYVRQEYELILSTTRISEKTTYLGLYQAHYNYKSSVNVTYNYYWTEKGLSLGSLLFMFQHLSQGLIPSKCSTQSLVSLLPKMTAKTLGKDVTSTKA